MWGARGQGKGEGEGTGGLRLLKGVIWFGYASVRSFCIRGCLVNILLGLLLLSSKGGSKHIFIRGGSVQKIVGKEMKSRTEVIILCFSTDLFIL